MIVVTGGAGFIGSNIVKALNDRGRDDILVVDNLKDGTKFVNIADLNIVDYLDQDDFLDMIVSRKEFFADIECIFHEGACSSTTEWDGQFVMRNNFEYSKQILHYCLEKGAACLYASSASVYGMGPDYSERREHERPINMYAYSKFQFDQYVRRLLPKASSQIAGFRYFNVYGPREQHKGTMASVAFHFNNQLHDCGVVKLFEGTDGYANGEQRRDFVYVGDAVDVNMWFMDNPGKSGIFNVGTGNSHSFNEVANAVIACHGKGEKHYIPFPQHLVGRYQSYTQADISQLRRVGYDKPFKSVAEGVHEYMQWLNKANA